MSNPLPLLIEPEALEARLRDPGLVIVDLSRASTHAQLHIPGAHFVDYPEIVATQPPVGGLLPSQQQLERVFRRIGLTNRTTVVAYDDEGGGKAARLLWSLEAAGHTRYALLDGGLHAWHGEKRPLTTEATPKATPSEYRVSLPASPEPVATREYILSHLDDPGVALIDARSPAEYSGAQRFAARGGHIPGAVNLEWTQTMDPTRGLRLKPAAALRETLTRLGIRPEQTVVAYCQTHHRSAHTWFMLKWLGYRAKGYPGSWSDWGNRQDVPVASG